LTLTYNDTQFIGAAAGGRGQLGSFFLWVDHVIFVAAVSAVSVISERQKNENDNPGKQQFMACTGRIGVCRLMAMCRH